MQNKGEPMIDPCGIPNIFQIYTVILLETSEHNRLSQVVHFDPGVVVRQEDAALVSSLTLCVKPSQILALMTL